MFSRFTTYPFDQSTTAADLGVDRIMRKASFCTIGTASQSGIPHVVGARYALIDDALYINVSEGSIKVRNVRHSGRAAICIPIRRIPSFPPYCIQFQAKAEVLPMSDPTISRLAQSGAFTRIIDSKHLDTPGICFIRVTMPERISTYGFGVSPLSIIRDPFTAMRSVRWQR